MYWVDNTAVSQLFNTIALCHIINDVLLIYLVAKDSKTSNDCYGQHNLHFSTRVYCRLIVTMGQLTDLKEMKIDFSPDPIFSLT